MTYESFMATIRTDIEKEAIRSGFYKPYLKDRPENVSVFHENKNENKQVSDDNSVSIDINSKQYKDKIKRLKKELKYEKIREEREQIERKQIRSFVSFIKSIVH